MSYCRFSSDDWKSDVYVYESQEGYVCRVASNRILGDIPPLLDDMQSPYYWVRHKEQLDFVSEAPRVPIGGDHDGEDFVTCDLAHLRDKLRELVAAGYHVPAYVFEMIEEELEEEKTNDKQKANQETS